MILKILFSLLLSITMLACAPMTMQVPADIANMDAELLNATERSKFTGLLAKEEFVIKPYQISNVDRDWNRTSSVSVSIATKEAKKVGFDYEFSNLSRKAKGRCNAVTDDESLSLGNGFAVGQSHTKISCYCDFDDGRSDVLLKSNNNDEYQGTFTYPGGTFSTKSIFESDTSYTNGAPVGYRIDSETEGAKGAVEVYHPGRIWLNKSLTQDQKDHMSCIFAGLMLYQPASDN